MNDLPLVDEKYMRNVFDTLSNMHVELDSDPLVFGPKRLNAKVALCRTHLSRCQQIYLQLADDKHRLGRAHRQAKLEFELQQQDLLANDYEVRSQKNIRDREAVASSKLRNERETMFRIETSIADLDSVISIVKAKREDLKDIQGRIRDQVKLCQEEISLGLRWGSAPSPGTNIDLTDRPRVNLKALEMYNTVLSGVDGDTSITDLEQFVRDETGDELELVPTPVVTPVQEPEVVAEPVENETHLPQVDIVEIPTDNDSSPDDINSFFNAIDSELQKQSPPPVQTANDELDIDDILGSFA